MGLRYLLSVAVLFLLPFYLSTAEKVHSEPFGVINLNDYSAFVTPEYKKRFRYPDVGILQNDFKEILPPSEENFRVIASRILPFYESSRRSFLEPGVAAPEFFTVVIPFEVDEQQFYSDDAVGLLLAGIGVNYRIFLNGHELTAEVHLNSAGEITKRKEVRRKLLPFSNRLLEKGRNYLTVVFIGDPYEDSTGMYFGEPYLLGSLEKLRSHKEETVNLILNGLYFFLGLYHLLLYIGRRHERYNLYFAGFTFLISIYLTTRTFIIFDLIDNTWYISKIELASLYLASFFLPAFFDSVLRGRLMLFTRVYGVFIALSLVILFTFGFPFNDDYLRIWQASTLLNLVYILYRVFRAVIRDLKFSLVRKKRLPAFRRLLHAWGDVLLNTVSGNLLTGTLVMAFTITVDILDTLFWYSGIQLTPFGFFIFVIGIAVSLANRFLNVHRKVEELNEKLEQKVEKRTAELRNTLKDVQLLKERQDGDYFLTSLLLQPLTENRVKSESIQVETLLEQKKKFRFRRWARDIGGDICIADNLELKGRRYIVFLNADAMGKSMQGAGGVLVLGSVFHSVLERTRLVKADSDVYPERWLKNTFLELHKIFESFDGSMLVSIAFGLADEETGFVYYMNAEHPWTVLYRDGKAEFIEKELVFRKLGTSLTLGQISVSTYQLEDHDSLILGSDGRDDIAIEHDEHGERVIRDDETVFLNLVEKTGADLTAIRNLLHEQGEVTDDLSLLKLTFVDKLGYLAENRKLSSSDTESFEEILRLKTERHYKEALQIFEQIENSLHPAFLIEKTRILLRLQNYNDAFQVSIRGAEERPDEIELIFLASYAGKLAGHFQTATDLGERVRLRNPHLLKNLLNLADLYLRLRNLKKAGYILRDLEELAPDNKRVRVLKNRFIERSDGGGA